MPITESLCYSGTQNPIMVGDVVMRCPTEEHPTTKWDNIEGEIIYVTEVNMTSRIPGFPNKDCDHSCLDRWKFIRRDPK